MVASIKQKIINIRIMEEAKEINIENKIYYFFDDMINIKNFYSNLLKPDKKSHKDTDIYYTGYITIKTFSDLEKIHSVNPLYLIMHSATGQYQEKKLRKILNYRFHREIRRNFFW